MQHFLKLALIFFNIFMLCSCANLGPKTFSINEKTLQSKLASHISTPITLMKVIHIQLSNPTIQLNEQTNRLNAMIDTQFTSPWIAKPLAGKMHISGMLRYAADAQAVLLDDAMVENIEIVGLDSQHNASLSALAKHIGSELLSGIVLYQLKPEDLRFGNTDYIPQDFKIIGNNLQVTLTPNPSKH